MTHEMIQSQIKLLNNEGLKLAYETCCDEYRKRLCEQWDLHLDSTNWDAPLKQGLLYIDFIGGIVLNIEQLKFVVDNGIKLDDFLEWWDYWQRNMCFISLENWVLNGLRPKDYEE